MLIYGSFSHKKGVIRTRRNTVASFGAFKPKPPFVCDVSFIGSNWVLGHQLSYIGGWGLRLGNSPKDFDSSRQMPRKIEFDSTVLFSNLFFWHPYISCKKSTTLFGNIHKNCPLAGANGRGRFGAGGISFIIGSDFGATLRCRETHILVHCLCKVGPLPVISRFITPLILGGGNSNIFYFHPQKLGNDPI